MVRAKFTCISNEPNGAQTPEDKGSTIVLHPVIGGSPENEQFYKWTPGGSIVLSTINEAAANQFEVGKSYYIDFSPAE
jgi:hypothetical protein